MEKQMNDYLGRVKKYLKPMNKTDTEDIIKEIESTISEIREHESLTDDQIMERMGDPKVLAKAYLGETITTTKGFSAKKFGAYFAFYNVVGLTGIIVLPTTGITAFALLLAGILCPVAGLLKLTAAMFGYDIPFILFQIGAYHASPAMTFFLSVISGVILILAGWGLWKVTKAYINAVSSRYHSIRYGEDDHI